MNYGRSINSVGCVKISEIVNEDWRKLSQSRDYPCRQSKRRLRERWRMKRNNIEEMHKQLFLLVNLLRKDGHDPLAIAGCMLAGAVQIYQTELGIETTQDLLDQIANGDDDDFDISVDKETIH
tara:strand:- start:25 stop:393 length:369 start_codon:yes stop_codon:yes gene_type:complete